MPYNNIIIDYYNNRVNIGSFRTNYNIGSGVIGAPICGDFIELYILVNKDIIVDCKFKAYGCGSAIAVSSFLSFYIKNKNIYSIVYIKNNYIALELGLPMIKLHCSVLVEEVLILSIMNYKNNYLFYDF